MEACQRDVDTLMCNFVGVAGRNWNAEVSVIVPCSHCS